MGDVVLRFAVDTGEVAQLFGRFLNNFIESHTSEVDRLAASSDAPYLMVKTDLDQVGEVKVITFQEPGAASAFSSGWAEMLAQGELKTA